MPMLLQYYHDAIGFGATRATVLRGPPVKRFACGFDELVFYGLFAARAVRTY